MTWIKRLVKNKTLYGTLMVFTMWGILHMTIQSNIIPSPYITVKEFIKIFPKTLSLHLFASLLRIMCAITLSMAIGVPLGLWVGLNKGADKLISPIIYTLYPLPKIAFLPVFMILFGLGDTAKITLIVSIIVFQILIAARDGVKEIPKELFHSVSSLGVGPMGAYGHLILPAIMPKLISGLRISIGISISALFFAENFATTYGIGYFIMNAWTMVDYQQMFSGILALSLLGLIMFRILDTIEERICPWVKASSK